MISQPDFLSDKTRPCLHVHEIPEVRRMFPMSATDEFIRTEFFHPRFAEQSHEAVMVCRTCPHEAACLHWAIENEETRGVFGGTSARERQALIKQHRAETGRKHRPLVSRVYIAS